MAVLYGCMAGARSFRKCKRHPRGVTEGFRCVAKGFKCVTWGFIGVQSGFKRLREISEAFQRCYMGGTRGCSRVYQKICESFRDVPGGFRGVPSMEFRRCSRVFQERYMRFLGCSSWF